MHYIQPLKPDPILKSGLKRLTNEVIYDEYALRDFKVN
jgi:hypothetical protein